jgi:hypothetical protein
LKLSIHLNQMPCKRGPFYIRFGIMGQSAAPYALASSLRFPNDFIQTLEIRLCLC